MPKVSIIIPTYNSSRILGGAIDSVLAQDFHDQEIIVVDDGSTDNTREVCAAYGDKIRYVRSERNEGIGAARQLGVESSVGAYIAFISSDDRFHQRFLSEMLAEAEKHPNEIIYCGFKLCNEKWEPVATYIPQGFENHMDFCIRTLEMSYKNSISVNFSSILAPTEAFRKVPFDKSLRFGEDLDSVLRLMKHFKFRLIPKPLVAIMLHPASATSTRFSEIPENNRRIIENFWGYWRG